MGNAHALDAVEALMDIELLLDNDRYTLPWHFALLNGPSRIFHGLNNPVDQLELWQEL